MKPLARFVLKMVAIALASGVLLVGTCTAWLWASGPPSDDALIANFTENRATLERLVQMAREDKGLLRVDQDWTDPGDVRSVGVSSERIALYRELFERAGVPRGFYSYAGGDHVSFIAYAAGITGSGCSKGYVYSAVPIVADTDRPLDDLQGEGVWLRQIAPHWYLELSSD